MFRIWGSILFFLFVTSSASAQSIHQIYKFDAKSNGPLWVVVYNEEQQLRADIYHVARDGWQELRETKRVHGAIGVQNLLKQLQRTHGPHSIERSNELPKNIDSSVSGHVIWPAKQEWNRDWELKYAEWIEANFDADFFVRYQLKTDCADAAYAVRWIFSRIHFLPAANQLAATGNLLTQNSLRGSWRALPSHENWWQDQRFMAALNYLLDNTYTHTLLADSYPLRIHRNFMISGAFHLYIHVDGGHTHIIHKTHYETSSAVPFHVLNSTVPKKIRILFEGAFWKVEQPLPGDGGFMQFRWPLQKGSSWVLKPREEHLGYSRMQYEEDMMALDPSFNFAVYKMLAPDYNVVDYLKIGFKNLKGQFESRVNIVEEGWAYCQRNSCLEGSSAWNDWSTPIRDRRILDLIKSLRRLNNLIPPDSEPEPEEILEPRRSEGLLPMDRFKNNEKIFSAKLIEEQNLWEQLVSEKIENIAGKTYTLEELIYIWEAQTFSSDPNVPIEVRWGVQSTR